MQRWSFSLAFVFVLALSQVAQAGPVEQLVQVAMHPKDPDVMVLRYEYGGEGIFVTRDGGKTWSYVCNSYIDPSTNARRGNLAVGGDGSLLLGVFDGIWRSDESGCGWSLDPALLKKWVPDITQDPTDPDVLYAITSNGDPGVVNGIVRRDATGAWSDLGSKEEMLLTRLRVVKNGDGVRFYESAVKGMSLVTVTVNGMEMQQPIPNYIIRVSDDNGETFEEYPVPAPEMGSFRLQAVDPSNPDRIVAWIDRDVTTQNEDSVMVSSDKGKTFTEYKRVSDLGGVAVAPDGRVWIADRGATTNPDAPRGLWAAANLDTEPTHLIDDLALSCLAYRADSDKLFACQLRKFGTIDPSSGVYSELFVFNKVENFAKCPGADMVTTCEMQLCRDYCALGHFPETPMCVAYQTTTCGPCSAIPAAAGCTLDPSGLLGNRDGGTAGSAGSTGSAGMAAGTGAGGEGGNLAAAGNGMAGMAGSAGSGDNTDDGCSVTSAGAGAAAHTGAHTNMRFAPMFLAALAYALRRRRRARD